jgi:hypothetical protein
VDTWTKLKAGQELGGDLAAINSSLPRWIFYLSLSSLGIRDDCEADRQS